MVEDNVRARRLYERLGFVASGQRTQDTADETIVHYAIDLPRDAG